MSYQILNPNSANYAATVSSNETARMRTMIHEITGLQNNTAASFTGALAWNLCLKLASVTKCLKIMNLQ